MAVVDTGRRIRGEGTTSEAEWCEGLAALQPPALVLDDLLPASQRLVVVSPHPDDEVLACGGLVALHAQRGGAVAIVAVTDGEASHRGDPAWPAPRLAGARRAERETGLARLGLAAGSVTRLGLPDSAVATGIDALTGALQRTLRAGDCVVSTWRLDGHPDHDAVGTASAQACADLGCRLLEAPVWMWHWSAPGDERVPWHRLRALPLPPATLAQKAAALAAHATQMTARAGEPPVLGPRSWRAPRAVPNTFLLEPPPMDLSVDPRRHFDELFAASEDPWHFKERWYEARKRALTLACLPRARYASGYEPGCANGELSAALAVRCERLLISDGAAAAVALAQQRVAALPHVSAVQAWVPDEWPETRFDLIVISELAYYLDAKALAELAAKARASLEAGGDIVACHWRHPIEGCRLDGDAVHAALWRGLGLPRAWSLADPDFRLEVWSADARSVAVREALV